MWRASHLTLNPDLKFHIYTIHTKCIHFSERETLEPSHCVNVASQQCRAPQDQCSRRQLRRPWMFWGNVVILLMEEILHKLIGSLSHYFQGFFTSQVSGGAGFLPSTVCHCMSLCYFEPFYLQALPKNVPENSPESISFASPLVTEKPLWKYDISEVHSWYIKCGVSNLWKWLRKLSVLYMNHMYSGCINLLIPLWSQNNSRTAWPSFSVYRTGCLHDLSQSTSVSWRSGKKLKPEQNVI